MCFVEIMYRVVNSCNASLLVVLEHLGPVDASMVNVDLSLHIQDSCDTFLCHCLGVRLDLGVWAYPYLGVANLLEGQPAYEVGICLLNVAVNYGSFAYVPPHV